MNFTAYDMAFESNVILDRYKTKRSGNNSLQRFESNVILDRYKTTTRRVSRLQAV